MRFRCTCGQEFVTPLGSAMCRLFGHPDRQKGGQKTAPAQKPRIITTKLCRLCGARWGSIEGQTCMNADCPDFR